MRFTLLEFSGSLGDLGTFIPLAVSMALVSGMDIGIILIFAGLFNILTGILFGLPIPVQPMKAIAAVAIAEQMLPAEIAAAGLAMGGVLLVLGLTGWVEKLEKLVPLPVIRGIQLGIGLKLSIKGIEFITQTGTFGLDSISMALALGGITLLLRPTKSFPAALLLLIIGVGITLSATPLDTEYLRLSLSQFSFNFPNGTMWKNGILMGALPQLPLTILNSVIAICALSGDLFPGRKIAANRMASSVGLMNLLSCGFGAMPMCHGSGGLAGQYHFGARTGGSVVMLGAGKLLTGLFFGSAAMQILVHFPYSVLGIMLLFAGVELAMPAKDQKTPQQFLVMIITSVGIVAINTTVGVLLGLAAKLLVEMRLFINDTNSHD